MQKILPPASTPKKTKNLWQAWNWKISDGDGKKTIALIKRKVKEQVADALKNAKTKKKRTVKYEWQFRVKIYLTPPATFLAGGAATADPPSPKQPPPPSM